MLVGSVKLDKQILIVYIKIPYTTIFLFGKGAPGVVSNAVPSFGKSSGGFVKSIVPTIETAVTTVNPGEMQLFLVEQKYIYSGAPLERTRY